MSESTGYNPIEAYCEANDLEYEIRDNIYFIKTSNGKYVEVSQDENGNFIIPTDKGDMTVSKEYHKQDALDAYLGKVGGGRCGDESYRYYKGPNGDIITIVDNGDDWYAVNKDGSRTHFETSSDQNEFIRNNNLEFVDDKEYLIVRIQGNEYKCEKTDDGYIIHKEDNSIKITSFDDHYEVIQDGKITSHEYAYDYWKFEIGENKIIVDRRTSNNGYISCSENASNRQYNDETSDYKNTGQPYPRPQDDMDAHGMYTNNEIFIRSEYFIKDENGNQIYDDNGMPKLTPMGQITYAHELQHWKNRVNSIDHPDGLTQEDVFKLNMLGEISATMAATDCIREGYKNAKTEEEKQQWLDCCDKLNIDNTAKDNIKNLIKNNNELSDDEIKKEMAKVVYNGWLQENNYSITEEYPQYLGQANDHAASSPLDSINDRISSTSTEEYKRRVNEMFSDIPGLGDVSDLVDGNFDVTEYYDNYDNYETLDVDIYQDAPGSRKEHTTTENSSSSSLKDNMKSDKKSQNEAMQNMDNSVETKEHDNSAREQMKQDKEAQKQQRAQEREEQKAEREERREERREAREQRRDERREARAQRRAERDR